MKKATIYIVIAFFILLAGNLVVQAASEVSGTITTDQGGSTQNGTTTPTPTPTPTPPAPADDDDTSSEVSGSVGNGNTSTTTQQEGTNTGNNNSGNNNSGNSTDNTVTATVTGGGGTQDRGEDKVVWDARWHGEYLAATTTSTTTTAADLYAPLGSLSFGPRYGAGGSGSFTPGPPDAGAQGFSQLSFSRDSEGNLTSNDERLFNFPPSSSLGVRYGEGQVTFTDDLAAAALVSGNGLTVPQLLIIALVGLAILASMGYAISRRA